MFNNNLLLPVSIISITFIGFAAFFIFIIVKNYYARIRHRHTLYEAVLETQEAERVRIGKELHDDLGVTITGIKLQLEALRDGETDKKKLDLIDEVSGHLVYIVDEIRQIVSSLTPRNLTENGWVYETNEFIRLLKMHSLIEIKLTTANNLQAYSLNTQLNLLRIMQELFTNAIKHSKATFVQVKVKEEENKLIIDYSDDGTGYDFTQQKDGHGLKNIQSRIELLKGRISNNTTYQGTEYRLQFNISDLQ